MLRKKLYLLYGHAPHSLGIGLAVSTIACSREWRCASSIASAPGYGWFQAALFMCFRNFVIVSLIVHCIFV
uniref:Uncharacterized protein n=1 Tax=Anguilla anguilla TaxID=7936 RepID=A0A0E9W5G5_ANGAN